MSLYYLLSSLPLLSPDSAPAVSADAFLDQCRAQLPARDAAAAEALLRGTPSDAPAVAAWRAKEAVLRNTVARERARALGTDAAQWLRPTDACDTYLESLAEDAFQETDPWKREKALDRARWLAAEELQGPDPLSVRAVFAYAVKLAIALRWAALDAAQGQRKLDTLLRPAAPAEPSTPPL